jgi:predicted O-methyltransferase YrrM
LRLDGNRAAAVTAPYRGSVATAILAWARDPLRLQRAVALAEIKINRTRKISAPPAPHQLEDVLRAPPQGMDSDDVTNLLREADQVTSDLRRAFEARARALTSLPFPIHYNADPSLAAIIYAIARARRPATIVELGVGYGLSSAVLLAACERNQSGTVTSIDLPPLRADPREHTGLAVPPHLRPRWRLLIGATRFVLPGVLRATRPVDLLVSDSANVPSLQLFELRRVLPCLSSRGFAVFNNVSSRFTVTVAATAGLDIKLIAQQEKTGCVTAVVAKL